MLLLPRRFIKHSAATGTSSPSSGMHLLRHADLRQAVSRSTCRIQTLSKPRRNERVVRRSAENGPPAIDWNVRRKQRLVRDLVDVRYMCGVNACDANVPALGAWAAPWSEALVLLHGATCASSGRKHDPMSTPPICPAVPALPPQDAHFHCSLTLPLFDYV